MKRILSSTMVVVLIMLVGCTSTFDSQLSTKQKVEDFEYMYKVISEGYPFLEVNKRLNGVDWVSNKDKYLKRIKNTKNDEEFLNQMTSIVSDLNNGHTHLINDKDMFEFVKNVYIQNDWYDFLDDETVINRYNSIGSSSNRSNKVMENKDVIVKDVVDGKIGYMHLPQMDTDKKDIEDDMLIFEKYIDTLENHQAIIIDIRGNSGGNDNYWRNLVARLSNNKIVQNGYMLFRNDSDVMKNYVDKRGLSLEPIEKLPIDVLKNAPKEVSSQFSEFQTIERVLDINFSSKFKGKIYLLVDKSVYSSSESFAIFCKDTGFATLVGEQTGGDGGGIDPIIFNLKNSGLVVRMSSDMYLTGKGICNEEFKTTPDYEVKDPKRTDNFDDDKCIQKVLELI